MDQRVLGIVQKNQTGFAKYRSVKRRERLGFVQVMFIMIIFSLLFTQGVVVQFT